MGIIRLFIRTVLFLILTVVITPVYLVIILISWPWRKSVGQRLAGVYFKTCLLVFGVDITLVGGPPVSAAKGRGVIIISNHVGFLDIFILSALFRTTFVSKKEVMYYPVFGQFAWLMGVVFLRRESPAERYRLIKSIADEAPGRRIAVFPQGTTSTVDTWLHFGRGVFKVVEINPGIVLQPVSLLYEKENEIAWVKGPLLPNALRVLKEARINVRVFVHRPYTIEDYKEHAASEVCRIVEQTVLAPLKKGF
jgi:1-acyl-sn-glycerol-3-phosphate acyltransferase